MAKLQQTKNTYEISTRGTFGEYKVEKVIIAGNVPLKTKIEDFIFGHSKTLKNFSVKKTSQLNKPNLLDGGKDLC